MIATVKRVLTAIGLKPLARKLIPPTAKALATLKRSRTVTRNGVRYRLDLHECIDSSIFMTGEWEADTCRFLRATVKSGDTVIEVGANIGAHTLLLGKLCAPGHVFAFEPTDYACAKLRANLALNPDIQNVTLIQAAVTNHEHAIPNKHITCSWPLFGGSGEETVNVEALALDEFPFDRISLFKVDVDGYDFKVLEGASNILRRFRPVVFVELCEYRLNEVGDSITKIRALMRDLDYQLDRMFGQNAVFRPS